MSTHIDSYPSQSEIFNRAELLLGTEIMHRLATARVIVFGVGGVGSWCAEGLIRSGIGNLTIVDSDRVCPSNINRQLMATTSSIDRLKVDVLRQRLQDINPEASIEARAERYNEATADTFDLESYDYIIDCIDSLADKALLIRRATASKAKFFSSMGAALRIDPLSIKTAEFWHVNGCPLARSLRNHFRRSGVLPSRKFTCVYSNEPPMPRHPQADANGSLVHITAIFGMTLCGLVINSFCNK